MIALALALLAAAPAARPCAKDPAYARLDFWLGRWDVVLAADGVKDGTNVIEKILGGCAVVENWTGVDGDEGKSLFYYNAVTREWKQVWVTDAGPLKEKRLVEDYVGGVRFQGELPLRDGSTLLDRTTLTPLPDGRVRQVIEQSRDGGKSWRVGFDALYLPARQP